ncbi:PAS domain-containing protein [Thalassobaculum sp.]|uniref:PAS domain-containing protein n=1 Tax=Thalassobaculum sp. TaxID=2022740 RepID=UPI0032EC7905
MSENPGLARAQEIEASAQDPALRDLVRYWIRIHPGTRLPGRQDFDPLDIPKVLKHLVLVDVERDPFRFRIRLMGTAVVDAFGNDFTDSYLDEVFENFHQTYGSMNRIETAKTGIPTYRHGKATMPFKLDFAPIEAVHLPLAADGRLVNLIVSMTIHMAKNDRTVEK